MSGALEILEILKKEQETEYAEAESESLAAAGLAD